MNKWVKMLTIISLLIGGQSLASSPLGKLDDENLSTCAGTKARKKFAFTVSTYSKVPSGMPVGEVSLYLKRLKSAYDSATSFWTKYLLSFGFQPNPDGKTSRLDRVKGLERFGIITIQGYTDMQRKISTFAVRTGDYNFVLCEGSMCKDLIDPISKKAIKENIYANTCLQYYVPEVEDPIKGSDLRDPHYCAGNIFSIFKLMTATGFHSGNMFNIWYFSVPDSDKTAVCEAAGLNEDCLKLPTKDTIIAYQKGDLVHYAETFPFTYTFYQSYMIKYNTTEDFIKGLNKDGSLRQKWEDAFIRDLLLRASIKLTKEVKGDWVINRIEWDPSLFCKYEKPVSDLVTH